MTACYQSTHIPLEPVAQLVHTVCDSVQVGLPSSILFYFLFIFSTTTPYVTTPGINL